MPTVFIPAALRPMAHGQDSVTLDGDTVGELVDALDRRYPGIKAKLCQGDTLRPGLAVVIDAQLARSGLGADVPEHSEVHFIPAIGGGASFPTPDS
ncbi:MAG: molybdopterin synthase sulfur carrier subunit [Gemmataceae bacterium]|nr:molybdopterin synthase sulfur carrier subunit [Gemmataceae bacterium]